MLLTKIKHFFCRHEWENFHMVEIHGYCEVFTVRCKKCGKIGRERP